VLSNGYRSIPENTLRYMVLYSNMKVTKVYSTRTKVGLQYAIVKSSTY